MNLWHFADGKPFDEVLRKAKDEVLRKAKDDELKSTGTTTSDQSANLPTRVVNCQSCSNGKQYLLGSDGKPYLEMTCDRCNGSSKVELKNKPALHLVPGPTFQPVAHDYAMAYATIAPLVVEAFAFLQCNEVELAKDAIGKARQSIGLFSCEPLYKVAVKEESHG